MLGTGTSFTEEKRLQVIDFPLSETENILPQFIGLANYFHDHVPIMTEMIQPFRKLIQPLRRVAMSDYQELYFYDNATLILQSDVSDFGVGGYMYMVIEGQALVIRFFSKFLFGSQLN